MVNKDYFKKSFEYQLFHESSWFVEQNYIPQKVEVPTSIEQSKCNAQVLFLLDKKLNSSYAPWFQSEEVTDMLNKIVKAMDLKVGSWDIEFVVDDNLDCKSILSKWDAKTFVSFGAQATSRLLGRRVIMDEVVGAWAKGSSGGVFMPIYHPEFMYLNPSFKRKAWEALKRVKLKAS